MQPRLVAVSYPSSIDQRSERSISSLFKFDLDTNSKLGSKLARKFRDVSWQDIRGQLLVQRRKRVTTSKNIEIRSKHSSFEAPILQQNTLKIQHDRDVLPSKWQGLPPSVQKNVIEQVELSYSHRFDVNAHRLRRNDLIAIQSTCKGWSEVAQRRLYETIRLKPNYDCDWYGGGANARQMRILQLRRTMRSSTTLAKLVKHLILLPENRHNDGHDTVFSDLVASVVMTCPNLETLTSFHVLYTHNFNRIFHALSTRTKLTEHTWIIGEDECVASRAGRRYSTGILSSQQTRMFLEYHARWKNLETLNIVSHNGRGILEHNLFIKTLNILPSLKRLHISAFDANDFSDATMLALPQLQSLRLDRCLGVTEAGLCQWAQSPAAANIKRLVLESQNITSLLSISALFSALENLEVFRMIQLEFEPGLPLELEVEQPLLASDTLKKFEWYVATGMEHDDQAFWESEPSQKLHEQMKSSPQSKSSQNILSSILEHGFPQLRNIVLPGYGNLNGLLRWVRHTSAPVQSTNTPSSPASARLARSSMPASSLRRSSSRYSLRPASPSFLEYDQWRPSVAPPRTSVIPEGLEPSMEETHESSNPASSSASISSSDSTEPHRDSISDPASLSDPGTHSTDEDDDAASISTRASTPAQLVKTVTQSTTSTIASEGCIEHAIAIDLCNTPRMTPKEIKQPPSPPAWGRYLNAPEPEKETYPSSRQSGISILLDGYAYTA